MNRPAISNKGKFSSEALFAALDQKGVAVFENFVDPVTVVGLREEFQVACRRRHKTTENFKNGMQFRILADDAETERISEIRDFFANEVLKSTVSAILPESGVYGVDYVGTWDQAKREFLPITHTHFDYFRTIKAMVYLDDTGEDNGAFRYAAGTHRRNAKFRQSFLAKGYSLTSMPNIVKSDQVSDHGIEMQPYCGAAGTLLVFDTEGFHTGGVIRPGCARRTIRSRSLFDPPTWWQQTKFRLRRNWRRQFGGKYTYWDGYGDYA